MTDAQRRRGATLDEAILDATWAELTEKGYAETTLEAVAKRAGTSRPVLHRRWATRRELVMAALARHIARNPISVADQGSVRLETIALLQSLSQRAQPDLLKTLFAMRDDLLESNSSLADLANRIGEEGLMSAILARGAARGEVDPSRITTRIASLPVELARHDLLMKLEPLSRASILEIVDDIFLPLVVLKSGAPTTGCGS